MATKTGVSVAQEPGVVETTWGPLTADDTEGSAENFARYGHVTVQVKGTFGGATVNWQGANDGSNYQTLTVDGSNAAAFAAAGHKNIFELPRYSKPVLATASGPTSLTVVAVARR